jgi:hypothetical protein
MRCFGSQQELEQDPPSEQHNEPRMSLDREMRIKKWVREGNITCLETSCENLSTTERNEDSKKAKYPRRDIETELSNTQSQSQKVLQRVPPEKKNCIDHRDDKIAELDDNGLPDPQCSTEHPSNHCNNSSKPESEPRIDTFRSIFSDTFLDMSAYNHCRKLSDNNKKLREMVKPEIDTNDDVTGMDEDMPNAIGQVSIQQGAFTPNGRAANDRTDKHRLNQRCMADTFRSMVPDAIKSISAYTPPSMPQNISLPTWFTTMCTASRN